MIIFRAFSLNPIYTAINSERHTYGLNAFCLIRAIKIAVHFSILSMIVDNEQNQINRRAFVIKWKRVTTCSHYILRCITFNAILIN